jgi:hypothetical protein
LELELETGDWIDAPQADKSFAYSSVKAGTSNFLTGTNSQCSKSKDKTGEAFEPFFNTVGQSKQFADLSVTCSVSTI